MAIELASCLNASSGSATEYQALRKELQQFVNILMCVVAAYEQRAPSAALSTLDVMTKTVVNECGSLIQEFLGTTAPRYHDYLQPGGSGRKFKDYLKRIEWSVKKKSDVLLLQQTLHSKTACLSLLIGLACKGSARADSETVLKKINEVREQIARMEEDTTLLQLSVRHEEATQVQARSITNFNHQLDILSTGVTAITSMTKLTLQSILQVKEILENIASQVALTHTTVRMMAVGRGLDPTKELPILLEDAHGIQIEITWVFSWTDLDDLIEIRFRGREGHKLVQGRQFALEDNCSGRELDRSLPFSSTFRRGMKVDMSMCIVINDPLLAQSPSERRCPRFQTPIKAADDVTVKCQTKYCGMWIRCHKRTEARDTETTCDPGTFQRVRISYESTRSSGVTMRPAMKYEKQLQSTSYRSHPLNDHLKSQALKMKFIGDNVTVAYHGSRGYDRYLAE